MAINIYVNDDCPNDCRADLKAIDLKLETLMSTVQDLISVVSAEQDLVAASVATIHTLADEVTKLVAAAGVEIPGLAELIDEVKANSVSLTAAVAAGTAAEALVTPAA